MAIPVILDTDIGDDIDDTWALVMLLKSPQLDLKLVTTTRGNAEYRAKIIAKMLTIAGRTDVPVGLGEGGGNAVGGQGPWVADYDLKSYPNVRADGTQALIDTIDASPTPVTVIAIGPTETLCEALTRRPDIAPKTIFIGMQGSVRKGYGGSAEISAEYNVKANIPASLRVLHAPWKRTLITPLDTCGLVDLSGERFQTLCKSGDKLARAVIENYRIWAKKEDVTASSTLFDCVAVYMAYAETNSLLQFEELKIKVDQEGFTRIDPAGVKMSVATGWKGYGEVQGFTGGSA